MALDEGRILITNDKDFGEKVFRDGRPHCGVILLRFEDERAASKIAVLSHLLRQYPAGFGGSGFAGRGRWNHVRYAAHRPKGTGPFSCESASGGVVEDTSP